VLEARGPINGKSPARKKKGGVGGSKRKSPEACGGMVPDARSAKKTQSFGDVRDKERLRNVFNRKKN